MDNKTVSRTLKLFSQLMELHNENSFRTKTIATAAYTIGKLPYSVSKKSLIELEQNPLIGKSVASKIIELTETGTLHELHELYSRTPPGIVEILGVKGLGPKKVLIIWKELGIENIGELIYACNENRLLEVKGFGPKTQQEIKSAIEFKMTSNGRFLYSQVHHFAETFLESLCKDLPAVTISFIGEYRRRNEIVDSLDFLIATPLSSELKTLLANHPGISDVSVIDNKLTALNDAGLKLSFLFCRPEDFALELLLNTGSAAHIAELKSRWPAQTQGSTETDLYAVASLPFIEPELREGRNEFMLAESGKLPTLIQWEDLKGSLHSHSTWSDGMNTVEEMALFCRDNLGLEYFGISDHSKSAGYAKGLYEERVLAQQREIDSLNEKFTGFKIFKGIESDILFDGSLDYPDEILSTFDFVVASIHSVFRMTEEKATSRLIKAIENPYTTILGHPSGRLLLSRAGYPVDFKKIIDACAANGVVIEINANPLRLDIDWRWHQYAIEKGVMLSINPDAHSINGFYDTRFGLLSARKGGVSAENCLNAMNLEQITTYFQHRKF